MTDTFFPVLSLLLPGTRGSDAETAEDNGVPMGRGGGGSFVGQAAGALGLVVGVAAMLV